MRGVRNRGFTLIELLTVISILLILMAILLPSLATLRRRTNRTADLSNIREFAQICTLYASDNDGGLPRGIGDTEFSTYWDDMVHFNYKSYLAIAPYGIDPTKKVAACITYHPDKNYMQWVGAWNGYDTRLGWLYWGGRKRITTRYVMDGNTQTSTEYVLPIRISDTPTSPTLITCMAYVSPTTAWGSWTPHAYGTEVGCELPRGQGPFSYPFPGLNMGYTDGSARWVDYENLGAIRDVDWLYYDKRRERKTTP